MFYTVFSTNDCEYMQWQSDLLEHSWKKVGQEGELIRLVATQTPDVLPAQKHARCVATRSWDIHPETGDAYPIYNKPGSLLEWVYRENPKGTVLFLDPDCIFRKPVTQTVAPGYPVSQTWINQELLKPSQTNPFGLGEEFSFLTKHCSRVDLPADRVMIPTLIHTSDLRRIAARWLELCRVVRDNFRHADGSMLWEADMFAYVAACAEYGLRHEATNLGVATNWDPELMPDAPIIHYCQTVYDVDGDELFNKRTYKPWSSVEAKSEAAQYYGRDLVNAVDAYIWTLPEQMSPVTVASRPQRRDGVMEGRVLDQLLLEIPDESKSVWINGSGMAVWELCDGSRTIEEICQTLSEMFEADVDVIAPDVTAILSQFQTERFLSVH
ncbi:MAG: PqqD family protein [Pseudomonadota bacterium]